jgi:hypothetical protein
MNNLFFLTQSKLSNITLICIKHFFSVLILFSFSACNEYWWTRGQPPSSSEIFNKALSKLEQSKGSSVVQRPEILSIANDLKSEFNLLILGSQDKNDNKDDVLKSFDRVENLLMSLENKLSYGNRPPYFELSGQFRALKQSVSDNGFSSVSNEALNLFCARVLFFISSELQVPAPDVIKNS